MVSPRFRGFIYLLVHRTCLINDLLLIWKKVTTYIWEKMECVTATVGNLVFVQNCKEDRMGQVGFIVQVCDFCRSVNILDKYRLDVIRSEKCLSHSGHSHWFFRFIGTLVTKLLYLTRNNIFKLMLGLVISEHLIFITGLPQIVPGKICEPSHISMARHGYCFCPLCLELTGTHSACQFQGSFIIYDWLLEICPPPLFSSKNLIPFNTCHLTQYYKAYII